MTSCSCNKKFEFIIEEYSLETSLNDDYDIIRVYPDNTNVKAKYFTVTLINEGIYETLF